MDLLILKELLLYSPTLLQGIGSCPFLSHELSFHGKLNFKVIVQKAKIGRQVSKKSLW